MNAENADNKTNSLAVLGLAMSLVAPIEFYIITKLGLTLDYNWALLTPFLILLSFCFSLAALFFKKPKYKFLAFLGLILSAFEMLCFVVFFLAVAASF